MSLGEKAKKAMKKFFGLDRFEFERIVIKQEVIEAIIELARQTHPKEFVSFLEGKVRKKALEIYGLNYQEYEASRNATSARINFPITSNVVGSVHSHPGPSNQPSNADLHFFSKYGMVHLIIRKPYNQEDIAAYDLYGNRINFSAE